MSLVSKLDTVWFSVRDMDRAVAFYQGVLGLELVYQSPYWSALRIGDVQLGLHGPSEPGLPPPAHSWVVCVTTDDLPGLRGALADAGATVDAEFHDTPRGAVLSFGDPDGNSLQAMQLGVKSSDLA